MINELHNLAKTLDANRIETELSSDLYLPLRQRNCLRIWLSETGSVCGIEELSSELASQLKTFGNDHNSFPVFNIKPLYRVTDDEIIKRLTLITENADVTLNIKEVRTWCVENNWIKDSVGKVRRSLQISSRELLKAMNIDVNSEMSIISKAVSLSAMAL
jgi:hypothetical protein